MAWQEKQRRSPEHSEGTKRGCQTVPSPLTLHIPAHNNRAENAIRPFVVGRKNWLFSQTAKGASASADMYSLVETAKANGLDVFEYLSWLFRQITAANHNFTDDFLESLMPWSEKARENC